jgi:hypothetical protein
VLDSTFGWTFKAKHKSDAPTILKNFVESSDRSIHSLKAIRFLTSDHGGEFVSKDFSAFLRMKGIFQKTGPPRTPNYNEQERHNRTLAEKQRALLKDANLPDIFWTFARETAQQMKNLTPTNALPGAITPFELFYGRKPDLRTIRAFGCPCYVHIHRADRPGRNSDTAHRGIFLGYNQERRSYNVFVHPNKIVVSRSVVFDEMAYIEHITSRSATYMEQLQQQAF